MKWKVTERELPQYNKTLERTQYHRPAEAVQLDSGERADGILEVLPDGYGFIRCENYRYRGKMIFMYHLLRYADLT